jgi:hypothetical protein
MDDAIMLALDDIALARVFISATAVPRPQRGKWLERVAQRLDPGPGAIHTRRWRQRERNGQVLLRVVADEAELAVALTDAGLLDPLKADDRGALAGAVERLLARFCEVSPPAGANLDRLRISLCLSALQPKEPPPCPTTTSGNSKKR